MKKGIVMEKHRRFTVVMQKDGTFHKALPIHDAAIGTEVNYQSMETKKKNYFVSGRGALSMIVMACLLLLLVVPFYFFNNTSNTYAYVSVDINPSVELEIDDQLRVHSITALNDDGETLISEFTDYQGSKLDQVIERFMSRSENEGLTANGKNMLIGVSYVPDEHEISVLDSIDNHFVTNNTGWKVATFQVPGDIRDTAVKNKQSVNELMASNVSESKDFSKERTKIHMNDEEEAIINSFYNNKNHSESDKGKEPLTNTNEQATSDKSEELEKKAADKHPSERKGNNGVIHSNGKNNNKRNNEEKNSGKTNKLNEKANEHANKKASKKKNEHSNLKANKKPNENAKENANKKASHKGKNSNAGNKNKRNGLHK